LSALRGWRGSLLSIFLPAALLALSLLLAKASGGVRAGALDKVSFNFDTIHPIIVPYYSNQTLFSVEDFIEYR
jgi:hypothetical protein